MKDIFRKMQEFEARGYYIVECECGGIAKAEIDASSTACLECGKKIRVNPVV